MLVKNARCVSTQERDAGEKHRAGVHSRSSDGLQQELEDACDGHYWTVHHRSALRLAWLFS